MFELGIALRACGLESKGRRQVLDALSHFTDRRTGLASVSDATLACHTGLSERSIRRIIPDLLDPSLAGLVTLVRRGCGRARASTYRIDLARIEPLGQAVLLARRVIYAGASKALIDDRLNGRPLTPDNIRAVFKSLLKRLVDGRFRKTRLAVMELASQFEREIDQFTKTRANEPGPRKRVSIWQKRVMKLRLRGQDCARWAVENTAQRLGISASKKGVNPDKMTSVYNIEPITSGLTPKSPNSAQTVTAQASRPGQCLLSASDLVAYVAGWRGERGAFLAEFGRRPAEVNRNGVLTVLCADDGEANALSARWMDGLQRYAAEFGLAGVVFAADMARV